MTRIKCTISPDHAFLLRCGCVIHLRRKNPVRTDVEVAVTLDCAPHIRAAMAGEMEITLRSPNDWKRRIREEQRESNTIAWRAVQAGRLEKLRERLAIYPPGATIGFRELISMLDEGVPLRLNSPALREISPLVRELGWRAVRMPYLVYQKKDPLEELL